MKRSGLAGTAPACNPGRVITHLRTYGNAPRLRQMRAPLLTALGAAATWAGVALANPTDGGRVWCPFRRLTGLDCPFCGATRAAAALGHVDLLAALDHNAFFVLVVLPVGVSAWIGWVRAASRGAPAPVVSNRALLAGVALTLAWWVLRLLVPWLGSGLASGPI